jgi:hypothetical protein
MSDALRLGRPYFLMLAVFTVGRWLMGTFRVPYESGSPVFSIVILTYLSAIYYGAFLRRWLAFRMSQAAMVTAVFGLTSQVVILLATALSFAVGVDTYYTYPRALNSPVPLGFAAAMLVRLSGLLFNTAVTAIAGALGWSLGGMLPRRNQE